MTRHDEAVAEAILGAVAAAHGITVTALRSQSTIRSIAWPRQSAAFVLHVALGWSVERIGWLLGDRHRTTIRAGVDEARWRAERDPKVAALHRELIDRWSPDGLLARAEKAEAEAARLREELRSVTAWRNAIEICAPGLGGCILAMDRAIATLTPSNDPGVARCQK